MSKRLVRLAGVAALAAVPFMIFWVFRAGAVRPGDEDEEKKEAAIKTPARVSRTAEGDPVIRLDKDAQERIGLEASTLSSASVRPQLTAYGRLQEDPSGSFELRAPLAGSLRPAPQRGWPAIGEVLARGTVVGILEPRLTSADRLNLADRLNAARFEAEAAGAALAASRAALDRTRALNADDRNMSDRALQEAEARMKTDRAKREAALATVRLLESSLRLPQGPAEGTSPLVIEKDGEVTEAPAQPGESVESGQVLLRIKRFDRLLARVQIPPGQTVPSSVSSARFVVLGYESEPLNGKRIAAGPATDPETQGLYLLFGVEAPRRDLRPGLALTAYLTLPGEARGGVVIPESAIVRTAGKMWAYVKKGSDQFVRREVPAGTPTGNGWFATRGFAPGDQIITVGAQMLLSEELKTQIQVGEENPG